MVSFEWNEEKNDALITSRGVSFRDVVEAIDSGQLLAIEQPSQEKYQHQKQYIVEIRGYVYVVPFVVNTETNTRFLKTIFPRRKMKKKYISNL
jgi:uncharacterized DUF497 family protein